MVCRHRTPCFGPWSRSLNYEWRTANSVAQLGKQGLSIGTSWKSADSNFQESIFVSYDVRLVPLSVKLLHHLIRSSSRSHRRYLNRKDCLTAALCGCGAGPAPAGSGGKLISGGLP